MEKVDERAKYVERKKNELKWICFTWPQNLIYDLNIWNEAATIKKSQKECGGYSA